MTEQAEGLAFSQLSEPARRATCHWYEMLGGGGLSSIPTAAEERVMELLGLMGLTLDHDGSGPAGQALRSAHPGPAGFEGHWAAPSPEALRAGGLRDHQALWKGVTLEHVAQRLASLAPGLRPWLPLRVTASGGRVHVSTAVTCRGEIAPPRELDQVEAQLNRLAEWAGEAIDGDFLPGTTERRVRHDADRRGWRFPARGGAPLSPGEPANPAPVRFEALGAAGKVAVRQWFHATDRGDWAEAAKQDFRQAAMYLGLELRTGPHAVLWHGEGRNGAFSGLWITALYAEALMRIKFPVDDQLHGIAQALEKARMPDGEALCCVCRPAGWGDLLEVADLRPVSTGRPVPAPLVHEVERAFEDLADWLGRRFQMARNHCLSDKHLMRVADEKDWLFLPRGGAPATPEERRTAQVKPAPAQAAKRPSGPAP